MYEEYVAQCSGRSGGWGRLLYLLNCQLKVPIEKRAQPDTNRQLNIPSIKPKVRRRDCVNLEFYLKKSYEVH